MFSFIVLVFAVFLALASDSASEPSTSPDIVDLGYAQHIPTLVNETTSGRKVRIYKNIRFANSPTGELRFRLPDTDLPIIDGIQDGDVPDPRTTASRLVQQPPRSRRTTEPHGDKRTACSWMSIFRITSGPATLRLSSTGLWGARTPLGAKTCS